MRKYWETPTYDPYLSISIRTKKNSNMKNIQKIIDKLTKEIDQASIKFQKAINTMDSLREVNTRGLDKIKLTKHVAKFNEATSSYHTYDEILTALYSSRSILIKLVNNK